MKINDKLYKKYGSNTVILPPPSEEILDEELEDLPLPDVEELAQLSLKPKALPEIKHLSDQEMFQWEQWLSAKNNLKDFNLGGSSGKEDSTIPPPPKKEAADTIVALCDVFAKEADAIRPPALEGLVDFVIPPSSKPPKILDPDEELMDAFEELRKKKMKEKADLLKEIEHSKTIHASSVDDIVKLSRHYYDLCRKL